MEADSIDVSVSATSKRKKKTLTRGPGVAVTQGEREKGEAAGARRPAASARPAQYTTREPEKLACWLRAEREKEMRLGQGGRREGMRAKTEMKKASIFLFLF
jgi:hypothetical protein